MRLRQPAKSSEEERGSPLPARWPWAEFAFCVFARCRVLTLPSSDTQPDVADSGLRSSDGTPAQCSPVSSRGHVGHCWKYQTPANHPCRVRRWHCRLYGPRCVRASLGKRLGVILGVWLVGAGVNYLPLALHAQSLSRPGALEAELSNVDVRRELRRAGVWQLWIAVPFAVAIAALVQKQ